MAVRPFRAVAMLAAALLLVGCGAAPAVTQTPTVLTVTSVSTVPTTVSATPSTESSTDSSGASGSSGSGTGSATSTTTTTLTTDTGEQTLREAVIPATRRTLWKPGVTYGGNGIPDRQTQCAQLTPSGGDDTAAIQQALNSCPTGQVVQLAAGTFTISGKGLRLTHSQTTLRGAGSGTPGSGENGTRLVAPDGGDGSQRLLTIGGTAAGGATSVRLAGDAAMNTTSVTLLQNPGVAVGEFVLLDQVTSADPAITWGAKNGNPGSPQRRQFTRQDRSMSQILEVTAVDGNTLTFATPLHWTFSTEFQAEISRYGDPDLNTVVPFTNSVGVEGIYFQGGNVGMNTCAYCWLSGIESSGAKGTSVALTSTYRSELRDSYIHSSADPRPGGVGNLVALNSAASDNLVENNVIWNGNRMIVMRATGGGNVVGYNFMQDGFDADNKDRPEIGLTATRYTTPHLELLEGNEAFNADADSEYGNSLDITYFRNQLTGTRVSAGDLGLTDTQVRRVVGLGANQNGYNFLGNVLGSDTMKLADGQQQFVYDKTENAGDNATVPMWMLGYNAQNLDAAFDPRVADTTLRHGNFDYVTKSVVWDPALPKQLPNSMYLPTKPAFFGSLGWPWVTPDVAGVRVAQLPAEQRFNEINPPAQAGQGDNGGDNQHDQTQDDDHTSDTETTDTETTDTESS